MTEKEAEEINQHPDTELSSSYTVSQNGYPSQQSLDFPEQGNHHFDFLNQDEYQGETKWSTPWKVCKGQARDVLAKIEKNSFNCVVTSPPYFWLRDYGVEAQLGLENTVAEYVTSILLVMDEVYKVLKSDGVLFLNLGDTYYSGKGKSHGIDRKSSKRRFGLRAVDKSGGMGIGLRPKTSIGIP